MRIVLLLAVLLGCFLPSAAPAGQPGLTLGPGATVAKDGRPYRGVGVNYFNCFLRTLGRADDTSYEAGFRVLAEHGIPFARFCAAGFWPREMHLYQTDREEYFRRFDGVVRSAERHGVGLIPSLFWHLACVPDLVQEPCDQWGNPASKTHVFMREYVREVVARYKNSPAIWAWEFGNEYALGADLPNAAQHRPMLAHSLGTPKERTARDELKHGMISVAYSEFAKEVRKYDAHRLITSGDSFPRASAWHNWRERTWKKDTPEQFAEMLASSAADPLNLISVHCYDNDLSRLREATAAAARIGKPLFVGEFQVPRSGTAEARKPFAEFLAELDRCGVPLAAVWVFDLKMHEKETNVTADNSRAWQLQVLREWNQKHSSR